MANVILGTPFDDTLSGTNGDDIIFGNAGNDQIDGKAGNDTIFPGPGNDSVFGGLGDDTIIYEAFGDNANDQVDGGPGLPNFDPGFNTLVTTVLVGDNFLNASSSTLTPATVWGSPMMLANINQVEVSNASVINGNPFLLDLSQDGSFGLPEDFLAENHYVMGMQATDSQSLHALDYTVSTGAITAGIPFDPAEGIEVMGQTVKSTFFLDNALAAQADFQALVDAYEDALAAQATFNDRKTALADAEQHQADFAALVTAGGAAVIAANVVGAVDGYDVNNPVTSLQTVTNNLAQAKAAADDEKETFLDLRDDYSDAMLAYTPGNAESVIDLLDAYAALRAEGYVTPPGGFDLLLPAFQAQTLNTVFVRNLTEDQLDASAADLDAAIVAAQNAIDTWAPLAQAVEDAWAAIRADKLFTGDPDDVVGANALDDVADTETAHANAVLSAEASFLTDPLWVGGVFDPAKVDDTETAHANAVANALTAIDAVAPIPGDIAGSLAALAQDVADEMDALDGVPLSFPTIGFGDVALSYDDAAGKWVLTYTAPEKNFLQPIINLESTVDDGTAVVTGTQVDGSTVDFALTFAYTFGVDIDLSGAMPGYTINGTANGNTIVTGDGDDIVRMNGGMNHVTVNGGDNEVWAGPGGTDDSNTVTILGDGNNNIGTGTGDDTIVIGAEASGVNVVSAGAGNDMITVFGGGANQIWGGAGDDMIVIEGNGDNAVGGGAGNDIIIVHGDGANTVSGGAGTGENTITINGNGANTVFGGNSAGTGGNEITVNGNGANTVFNGSGNDTVHIQNDANEVADAREVILWGGQGDDEFFFDTGSAGTLTIQEGNGNNTIFADSLLDDQNIMVDLRGVFSNANDVVDNLFDLPASDGAVLLISAESGDTLTFNDYNVSELLVSVNDWLIV